jgi:magnesium transporter
MRVIRAEGGAARVGGRELVTAGAPIWIDCAPTPENLAYLGATFGFHPLALEDCAHEDQRPKFDQYPGTLFVVVHRLTLAPDDSCLVTLEVNAFLTAEAVVTVHSAPVAELDQVFERCAREPDLLARGADFALYLVHDALTDIHYALVDALATEIDELSELALRHDRDADSDVLERIAATRRSHAILRRRLAPQREVFAALARPGQQLVKDQTAVYFRDVMDHSARLTEEVDTGRELLASAMDVYLSQANNRLTRVTTRLTLAATIFLPLNFVAGFFGMNLEILPAGLAVPIALATMAALPAAMFGFFRWRRWT